MVRELFGDRFGQLRADMPEKRMTPGTEQAHEAVSDENEAGEFEQSLLHKVRIKNCELRSRRERRQGQVTCPKEAHNRAAFAEVTEMEGRPLCRP